LLDATLGAQRLLARLRPAPTRRPDRRSERAIALERRGLAAARRFRSRPGPGPLARLAAWLTRGPRLLTALGGLLERERALPVALALLVVVASFASVGGVPAGRGGTGAVGAAQATPRLAIAGLAARPGAGRELAPADALATDAPAAPEGTLIADPPAVSRLGDIEAEIAAADAASGPALTDGTLLKPVVVDTSVSDGRDLLRTYRVRPGDTLTGIARRFGVSMMTIWWANDLASKDDLVVGQTLVIPPVSGLVVTVKEGDTLDSIAAAAGVEKEAIYAFNGLEDETLVAGGTLVIPGARGDAIPTPKPVPPSRSSGGGATGSVRTPVSYTGGAFAWPVPGGYISQYFHYGHSGLDIAADYGVPVRAAAAGTVVFAGWKGNGGGYQVWIAHGSGLYTTYNHLASVSVGSGQRVARGQQIARNGQSGWATGPHVHFEVWVGPIWDGGRQVNPLRYL
jgi:murein DD-endopeptidase MepM/ murein hydrolase activator NlpD